VYKSLFLLFSLAFFAAAGLHSGGAGLREVRGRVRLEARDGIASLRRDLHTIRTDAARTPNGLKSFWKDVRHYIASVRADAGADARRAGKGISRLVKTT
jgi:hypothetical protein